MRYLALLGEQDLKVRLVEKYEDAGKWGNKKKCIVVMKRRVGVSWRPWVIRGQDLLSLQYRENSKNDRPFKCCFLKTPFKNSGLKLNLFSILLQSVETSSFCCYQVFSLNYPVYLFQKHLLTNYSGLNSMLDAKEKEHDSHPYYFISRHAFACWLHKTKMALVIKKVLDSHYWESRDRV